MSDSIGVTFKRKGAKHSQRSRPVPEAGTADSASDVTAGTGEESSSVIATKLKNKQKSRLKPRSKLSFGGGVEDEGDDEVFQVKKSNLSRKLQLNKQALPPGNLTSSYSDPTTSQGGPRYNDAYLSELKASTPSSRPRLVEDESTSYDEDISMATDSLAQSSLAQAVDIEGDVDMDTTIPSNSSILAAKEKRERLRKVGSTNEDFISLSVTKRDDYSQGPHPESRLVREEDELGEADDEFAEYTSAQERIALGKKSRKVEARKRREAMNELIVDAEEQDEETMEWELEQLRRGGLRSEDTIEKAPKPTYKPTPIPSITPIPTLGPAIARLTHSLTALTTSHAQNTASMTSLADERTKLESREKEMRDMIANAEEKRSWFSAFREWVESVATFLDEKFPQLEKLEEEHVSLLQERYDMISKRRTADSEDDLSLFLGTLPSQQSEEIDEIGRLVYNVNSPSARRDRRAARIARRTGRRARQNDSQEDEGYSTDSSLPPSDAADYETAVEKLLLKRRDVLSDVRAKDFQDPGLGLGKWFGEWRDKFGDSYTGAWGGLGMVSGWEFWTRLEIVGWNPLEDETSFDTFAWYKSLYDYSRPRKPNDEDDDEAELGPDGDLVSAMISTAIIPRICKIVESGAFDPYSAKDVRTLIDLAEQIESSVEKDNLKFQMLLKSAFTIFQREATSTQAMITPYLALNNPKFDPEAIPARRRFLARCYKLLNNIVRWRKYTGERFGAGILVAAIVSNCMLPVAENGWEVGGEEYMRKVQGTIPKELIPSALNIRL